ncbi:hypothetical protein HPB52_001262 [Rhipicephalus sanguineus]|uniref:Peptidase M13 N-terminal domain-containing protein n=1 Tax=Rhipicephalus sanguineus TaxID=34632 RepID=A0A9D4T736_RHISA|nr:hypothetical protein HPB52_001262 [Rhipicephalus sanguineus]
MEDSTADETATRAGPTRKSRSLQNVPARKSSLRQPSSTGRRLSLSNMSVRWEDQQPSSYLEQADEKSTRDAPEQRDLEESSNDRTGSSLMRSPAKTSLIAAVLLLSAVVAGTFFTGAHSHEYAMLGRRWRTPSPRLCRSEPCRRLATLLADAVNRSVRPCVNFHDYVCGGWLRSRSMSVSSALRGELIDKITREARNVEVPDLHQTPSEKAARYFTACDDVVSGPEDHLDEVKELLRKGGIMWPDVDARADLIGAIFYMSRMVRVPILFELSFDRGTSQNKVFVFNTMHMLNRMINRNRETKKSTAKNFFRTLYEAFSGEQASDTERRFTSLAERQTYSNDKERLLDVFRKYEPPYVKETYSSYPDMTSNPLANWIGAAEAASAMNAEEIPVGDLMFGHEARAAESPVDLAYLDVLWYTLGAPHAVKLAGLGSQVTKMVFHEILSSKKPCQRLLKNTDKLWKCMTATEPGAKHLRAVKENVLVSLLSQIVLWPILRDSLADGSRALADFGSLPEPELFFVLACLPLCGEEHAEAMCNLPLKQSLAFSQVFSCRRGAHMRPKFQCNTRALRPRLVDPQ